MSLCRLLRWLRWSWGRLRGLLEGHEGLLMHTAVGILQLLFLLLQLQHIAAYVQHMSELQQCVSSSSTRDGFTTSIEDTGRSILSTGAIYHICDRTSQSQCFMCMRFTNETRFRRIGAQATWNHDHARPEALEPLSTSNQCNSI